MRVDAKALLDRLGKNEFAYKEFADRFSELELWPLFEALLKDPRMASLDDDVDDRAEMVPEPPEREDGIEFVRPKSAQATTEPAQKSESFGALFGRYENAARSVRPAAASRQSQDVRTMLRQLSQLSEDGDL